VASWENILEEARQLSKVFDYTDFRNFTAIIEKAWNACKNSGNDPKDHIVEANEMVTIGSGAEREMPDYKLSRYACYLIVQNADPSKEVVAIGMFRQLKTSVLTFFLTGIPALCFCLDVRSQ
jgi:hypothetical protein